MPQGHGRLLLVVVLIALEIIKIFQRLVDALDIAVAERYAENRRGERLSNGTYIVCLISTSAIVVALDQDKTHNVRVNLKTAGNR